MNATRPTREDLDAAGLRTVVAYAITAIERDCARAEACLEVASTRRIYDFEPPTPAGVVPRTPKYEYLAALDNVDRLRTVLYSAREIARLLKLRL